MVKNANEVSQNNTTLLEKYEDNGLTIVFCPSKLRGKCFKDSVCNTTIRFAVISSLKTVSRLRRRGRTLPVAEGKLHSEGSETPRRAKSVMKR